MPVAFEQFTKVNKFKNKKYWLIFIMWRKYVFFVLLEKIPGLLTLVYK